VRTPSSKIAGLVKTNAALSAPTGHPPSSVPVRKTATHSRPNANSATAVRTPIVAPETNTASSESASVSGCGTGL
jgi:hypothetical protein